MYMSWSCIEQWCICHDHACKRIDLTSVSTILLLDVGTVPTVECFIFQFMSSDIKFPGSDCWLLSYITSDYYPHPFNICNDHACCDIEFPLFLRYFHPMLDLFDSAECFVFPIITSNSQLPGCGSWLLLLRKIRLLPPSSQHIPKYQLVLIMFTVDILLTYLLTKLRFSSFRHRWP